MIFLKELNNRLYFYIATGSTFKLCFFENSDDTTTLHSYSNTFASIEDLLCFFLFATSQTLLNEILAVMPKSLPFVLRYEKAVKVLELKSQLRTGVIDFEYSKKDGTTRPAKGTLISSYLPVSKNTGRKTAKHLVSYFDLDANAYRCFIAANII